MDGPFFANIANLCLTYILLAATKKKFEKYFQSRNGLSNPLMSIFLELLRGLT